jgi:hypothetical protein
MVEKQFHHHQLKMYVFFLCESFLSLKVLASFTTSTKSKRRTTNSKTSKSSTTCQIIVNWFSFDLLNFEFSFLIQEPSLLHGFEDEVIIEKSRRANEPVLPDLLQSNLQAGNAASKSALTPRVYFENKSNQIFLLSNNVISLFF